MISVRHISKDFGDGPVLKDVSLPASLRVIEKEAFTNCYRLPSITISPKVTRLEEYTFYENDALARAVVPKSVTYISEWAFCKCPFVTLYGDPGSRAESFAKEQGIPFVSRSLSGAKVSVEDAAWNGKARKPAVTVTLNGRELVRGEDYTVKYDNNTAIGRAKVTVTGAGVYTGKAKATFLIRPKKVGGLKAKAGSEAVTVTWKKASGISGYQIQYGLKQSFKGAKSLSAKKSATKATVKNLKKGRTWYVRIRAYKTVKGKKIWSEWSAVNKVKVK